MSKHYTEIQEEQRITIRLPEDMHTKLKIHVASNPKLSMQKIGLKLFEDYLKDK